MNDQDFRKTEAFLYQHYDNIRQVDLLEDRIQAIAEDIKLAREAMEDEGRYLVAHYGNERVSGKKSVYNAPQEAALLEVEDHIISLRKQQVELMRKASRLNQQIIVMEHALEQLIPFDQKIVKCIYCDRLNLTKTAMVLNMGYHSNVRRIRNKIVHRIFTLIQDQECWPETETV